MFNYSFTKYNDIEIIELTANCGDDKLSVWIAPEYGANMCRYTYNSKNIIDFTENELKTDYTGNPMLYPTPNRVKNGEFVYNGKTYIQEKNGKRVLTHGLVHDEKFTYHTPVIKDDCVSVCLYIDFNEKLSFFKSFPFESRYSITYKLYCDRVVCEYSVENYSDEAIPYGNAFHPYFMKLDGDETYVKAPFATYYENTPELFPTTRMFSAKGTKKDLTEFVSVNSLDVDDVFTDNLGGFAEIWYKRSGYKIVFECSGEFTHAVVYVPKGEEFFCVENQTCSTNAHNLYAQGYIKESGLKFIAPKSTHIGFVCYHIVKDK